MPCGPGVDVIGLLLAHIGPWSSMRGIGVRIIGGWRLLGRWVNHQLVIGWQLTLYMHVLTGQAIAMGQIDH